VGRTLGNREHRWPAWRSEESFLLLRKPPERLPLLGWVGLLRQDSPTESQARTHGKVSGAAESSDILLNTFCAFNQFPTHKYHIPTRISLVLQQHYSVRIQFSWRSSLVSLSFGHQTALPNSTEGVNLAAIQPLVYKPQSSRSDYSRGSQLLAPRCRGSGRLRLRRATPGSASRSPSRSRARGREAGLSERKPKTSETRLRVSYYVGDCKVGSWPDRYQDSL
jgi:hypothetical protein